MPLSVPSSCGVNLKRHPLSFHESAPSRNAAPGVGQHLSPQYFTLIVPGLSPSTVSVVVIRGCPLQEPQVPRQEPTIASNAAASAFDTA